MYSKMRLHHGGDAIRTAAWIKKHAKTSTIRNNSYIRASCAFGISFNDADCRDNQYEITFGHEGEEEAITINYGALEKILVCNLGEERIWDHLRGTTQILAIITPWRTNGKDAALETVFFKHTLVPVVTDLRNICAAVGRVESRGKWGIVDRNNGMVHAVFAPDELSDGDADSDDSDK